MLVYWAWNLFAYDCFCISSVPKIFCFFLFSSWAVFLCATSYTTHFLFLPFLTWWSPNRPTNVFINTFSFLLKQLAKLWWAKKRDRGSTQLTSCGWICSWVVSNVFIVVSLKVDCLGFYYSTFCIIVFLMNAEGGRARKIQTIRWNIIYWRLSGISTSITSSWEIYGNCLWSKRSNSKLLHPCFVFCFLFHIRYLYICLIAY